MKRVTAAIINVGVALLLAWSGYIHLDLYRHGYRSIPRIGVAFQLQASGSFAVAGLLLVSLAIGGSPVLRLAASALAAGALGAFILSRTIGVFGFIEHGLEPSPDALTSVIVETAVLLLLAIPLARYLPAYATRRLADRRNQQRTRSSVRDTRGPSTAHAHVAPSPDAPTGHTPTR